MMRRAFVLSPAALTGIRCHLGVFVRGATAYPRCASLRFQGTVPTPPPPPPPGRRANPIPTAGSDGIPSDAARSERRGGTSAGSPSHPSGLSRPQAETYHRAEIPDEFEADMKPHPQPTPSPSSTPNGSFALRVAILIPKFLYKAVRFIGSGLYSVVRFLVAEGILGAIASEFITAFMQQVVAPF